MKKLLLNLLYMLIMFNFLISLIQVRGVLYENRKSCDVTPVITKAEVKRFQPKIVGINVYSARLARVSKRNVNRRRVVRRGGRQFNHEPISCRWNSSPA